MEQGVREVSGSEVSLAECIANGSVPKPELGDWNTWVFWRRGAGRRPEVSLGDPLSTSARQEADLRRSTMQKLYGADWRTQLEEAQLAAAEAEEAAGTPSVAYGPGTRQAAPGVTPGWGQRDGKGWSFFGCRCCRSFHGARCSAPRRAVTLCPESIAQAVADRKKLLELLFKGVFHSGKGSSSRNSSSSSN